MQKFFLVMLMLLSVGAILLFGYLHFSEDVRNYILKIDSGNTTAGMKAAISYSILKLVVLILGIAGLGIVWYRFHILYKRKDL